MVKKEKKPMPKGKEFSSEYQPTPEAKSKGKKAWWDEKKLHENARSDIYNTMLKKLGQTADGDSVLHEKIAEVLNELLETPDKDNLDTFYKFMKEFMPSKPTETTHKGDAENPLVVQNIDEKDKAILARLQKKD